MKKKAKRYQSGGKTEEDYKREGLASSKGDKVGFFERLRMGNIDSPGSEAYYKFGAGRAKMAEEARTPVPEMSSDYSGRGARSTESSQRFPVDEAGIESRRQTSDYSSESSDTSPSMAERLSAASPGSSIRRMDGEGPYTSPLKETTEEKKKPKKSKLQRQTELARKMGRGYAKAASSEATRSTGTGASGFKSGGKVSSASSRADGIAQRGKTRGRMC